MKTASILAAIAMLLIVLMTLADTSESEYNRGYMDGYSQYQTDNLIAIGTVANVIKRKPELKEKP